MSTMLSQLLETSETFCRHAGIGRQRLSTLMLGAGHRLDTIAGGGDVKTGTYENAMQWLSDNWPKGAVWPARVARPAPKAKEAAE